jgi:DMSO reductase family type II enzyme heme b subunit
MGLLRSRFVQAVLVLVVAFAVFRFGIRPPAPWSVVSLYMGIVLLAVLVYVSSDSDAWRDFLRPLRRVLLDDSALPLLGALMVALPLCLGYYAFTQAAAVAEAPPELRAVHPAPPASISFRGKSMDIQGLENPLRADTARFREHVAEGGRIYVRNCMFCHGDNLDGGGHFAHAFNPPPANFTDPGTIAMLQEAYLFWRIAKGGPGLPKEATPWNSVMPAWEDRLTETQIWQVILYLYDATGYQPRRWEEGGQKHAAARPAAPGGRPLALLGPRAAHAQGAGDPGQGRAVYEKRCALCHGDKGDGAGAGADLLSPRPRDFTKGKYKIRTSGSGKPPTDQDLFRIITDGMPGTSMPGWKALPDKDRWNLVAYVKGFAGEAFKEAARPAELPREVPTSAASVARGKEMFEAIECHKCHGAAGRGDGPSAPELKDDWEQPVRAANLTRPWTFRGGGSARDIAARLATGLAGTPMPSFLDSVEKPEDIWHLANYVKTLGPDRPGFATMLRAAHVSGPIPDDPAAAFWTGRPGSTFPLAGQVIVEPRNVNPSVDLVTVRAVYSDAEIAFHLTWDDPTASRPDPGARTFADAVAVQLPARPQDGTERPWVLMGEGGNPVLHLRWTSDAGVAEATATGIAAVAPRPAEAARTSGRAVFADGQYRLVLKRPRAGKEAGDLGLEPGGFVPVAFLAWDGGAGETGPRLSFSSWYPLHLEEPASGTPYVIPPLVALVAGGLEVLLVRRIRRRARGGDTLEGGDR